VDQLGFANLIKLRVKHCNVFDFNFHNEKRIDFKRRKTNNFFLKHKILIFI